MEIEKKEGTELTSAFVAEPERKVTFLERIAASSEKELFVENLSLLLASGMDTLSALTALKREVKSGGMIKVIGQIEKSVEGGMVLSDSLERTGLFGTNVTALVKIGEETGKLSENMRVVASSAQKERSFRSKITSAMMYPVLVFSLTLIIGVSISWLVLPRLANVFSQLRINLPWITKVLIDLGEFLAKYGVVFVPSFILGLLLLVYFIFVNPRTKFIGQEMLFSFPGVGQLVSEVELSRFGFMLGNMLAAGLPVVTAFNSLIEVTEFKSYRKFYEFLRDRVEEGNSFAKSFSLYKDSDRLMPPSIQQMIAAAEQSGFLADALVKIGERFEEKTELTTKNISTLLEPLLLVVVFFGVAVVALAVILPIYSLVGGFTQTGTIVTPTAVTVTPGLTPTSPSATEGQAPIAPIPTAPPQQIVVSETGIGYLNIREEASTGSPILGRASPGERYSFVAREGEWYQINLPEGGTGWVNAAYVEELP